MKREYIKPIVYDVYQIRAFVPIVAFALGVGVATALGAAAVSSSKKSGFDFTKENFIPSLEPVEVFR